MESVSLSESYENNKFHLDLLKSLSNKPDMDPKSLDAVLVLMLSVNVDCIFTLLFSSGN